MSDRGRYRGRVFPLKTHAVDNDDDTLAPVVLAIDAVQQLLEEETRSKSSKIRNSKKDVPETHAKNEDATQIISPPVISKTESKLIECTELDDQTPSSSTSIAPFDQIPVRQVSDANNSQTSLRSSDPVVREASQKEVPRQPEDSTLTIIKNNRVVEFNDTKFQRKQDDYELIPKSVILDVYSNDPEVKRFLKQLPKICNEFGFNEQDYKCYSCRRPIGMVFGQSRLCHFDGHHYCSECHLGEKTVVPARILCNWDFNKYTVSKRNLHFLTLISNEAMFELKVMAPLLYKNCLELVEIEELRCQAFFVRSYCFTCADQSVSLDLTKLVWPREHLIKQTDTYSIEDLTQKGFICELCKSSQIIYPFDTDSVHRCNSCQSIYHKACFKTKSGSPACPRCQRLKARKNES